MPSKHVNIGKHGERFAKVYLKSHGYQIVAMNYRYERYEIDIIAKYEDELIFVEVKTRSDTSMGFPEEHVDQKKVDNIQEAAEHYLVDTGWKGNVRFDIISIILKERPQLRHLKDAF